MSFLSGLLKLFGVGQAASGGTNVVREVADIVSDYKPGAVTQHKMDVEHTKAEDASQDSARQMVYTPVGGDLFNRVVDGLNRLPRPLMALWAFGILVGVIPVPDHLAYAHPLVLNILWTVIGFYFGIRTISQDLPRLLSAWRKPTS